MIKSPELGYQWPQHRSVLVPDEGLQRMMPKSSKKALRLLAQLVYFI